MRKVQALMENAVTKQILAENADSINSATAAMNNFYGVLNNYITENISEFLDENLEETSKNIYTFSAYATKQMLTELSTIYGNQIHQQEVLREAARTEFV